jgi:hypothetical protein
MKVKLKKRERELLIAALTDAIESSERQYKTFAWQLPALSSSGQSMKESDHVRFVEADRLALRRLKDKVISS